MVKLNSFLIDLFDFKFILNIVILKSDMFNNII